MKKIFVMMFALTLGMGAANAQEVTNAETIITVNKTAGASHTNDVRHEEERERHVGDGHRRRVA